MSIQSLKPSQFYNKDIEKFEIISLTKATNNASRCKNESRRMPLRITGPTQFWQLFHKQAKALEVARKNSGGAETICTFVHENEDGVRKFIVAHPEVYWWYNIRHPSERRCSYEVIPDGSPCWLYFDLEFQKDLNPDSDGPKMTETLIKIFCAYLLKYYDLPCDERNVLNLDSTRRTKFSRHLIFCIRDIAFYSNLHVGRFVKGVCREIEEYLENSAVLHDILSQYERKDLEKLFIKTDKKRKLFIDTGVYTRNRHFRIYKSTKWGKLWNFEVAPECKHEPLEERSDKELAIFLDSLISYFPNKRNLTLLEIKENDSVYVKNSANCPSPGLLAYDRNDTSRYPELDKFILSLVKPGKIRLCKQYCDYTIYEIVGQRYCANIDRQHKSNNVYWIANLRKKNVYQKCHDEDCADFASKPIAIPQEVCFQFDDEFDNLFLNILEPESQL